MTRDITPAGSPATGAVDEAYAEVRASFDRFCLAAGIEVLGTMMEADVTAACGPRHGRDTARRAHRWGRTRGRIGFHGGKIEVERPRVRDVEGREVTIPSWETAAQGGLARSLGDEPDADQRVDAPVRPRCPAARG
jgi:putative transposase